MKKSEYEEFYDSLTYEMNIPLIVALHSDLRANDFRVYFVLTHNMGEEDHCIITNQYIADVLQLHTTEVHESIRRLTLWNIITVFADENENGTYTRIISRSATAYDLYSNASVDFYRRLYEIEDKEE